MNDNNVQGYLMFGFKLSFIFFQFTGLQNGVHLFFILQPLLMELLLIIWWTLLGFFFIVQAITQVLLWLLNIEVEGSEALYFADNNKLEAIWVLFAVWFKHLDL
jgi:hypothetical protein